MADDKLNNARLDDDVLNEEETLDEEMMEEAVEGDLPETEATDANRGSQVYQDPDNEAEWYVIHTYSGYENKVKTTLEQVVENRGLHDYIQEIEIPVEEIVEIKDGKKKTSLRKIYPGYALIKMVLTDEI